jgi:hypothetical protein
MTDRDIESCYFGDGGSLKLLAQPGLEPPSSQSHSASHIAKITGVSHWSW